MEVNDQVHAPPTLPPGKEPLVPIGEEAGWAQSRSGRGDKKNSQPLPGLDPPIIQPVAQRYTVELLYYALNSFVNIIFICYCRSKVWDCHMSVKYQVKSSTQKISKSYALSISLIYSLFC
jgi:hypothetical protein